MSKVEIRGIGSVWRLSHQSKCDKIDVMRKKMLALTAERERESTKEREKERGLRDV